MVIGAKLLITDQRSLITSRFVILGAPVQIALQNHLGCHLIDVAAGVSGFLACVTECAVGRDGG